MNTHLLEHLARARLDEARAKAAHSALICSLRPVRQPLRVLAGLALIRAGRWLARYVAEAVHRSGPRDGLTGSCLGARVVADRPGRNESVTND